MGINGVMHKSVPCMATPSEECREWKIQFCLIKIFFKIIEKKFCSIDLLFIFV